MKAVIHKYTLTGFGEAQVPLPSNHKIIMFAIQYGVPTIWVALDPDEGVDMYNFLVAHTNYEVNMEEWGHVASAVAPVPDEEGMQRAYHLMQARSDEEKAMFKAHRALAEGTIDYDQLARQLSGELND